MTIIQSEPIQAGEDSWIRICLIEDDFRIRITNLIGDILFELEYNEIVKFQKVFSGIVSSIEQLKSLELRKDIIKKSIPNLTNENNIFQVKETSGPFIGVSNDLEENSSPPSITSNPEGSKTELKLIRLYPKLSKEDLELCIKAVREKMKLNQKTIIDSEQNY